jgi:hypothetical protein
MQHALGQHMGPHSRSEAPPCVCGVRSRYAPVPRFSGLVSRRMTSPPPSPHTSIKFPRSPPHTCHNVAQNSITAGGTPEHARTVQCVYISALTAVNTAACRQLLGLKVASGKSLTVSTHAAGPNQVPSKLAIATNH